MPQEAWRVIPEFPLYSVSSLGRVMNNRTERVVSTNRNNFGHIRVTLSADDTTRYTRSVALLVADAFVEPPDDQSDRVILLDGKLHNVRASNLMWRPLRFAYLYARQLKTRPHIFYENLSVYNITNRRRYKSVVHCGIREGLLFDDIWDSTYLGTPVYPYWHTFRINHRV